MPSMTRSTLFSYRSKRCKTQQICDTSRLPAPQITVNEHSHGVDAWSAAATHKARKRDRLMVTQVARIWMEKLWWRPEKGPTGVSTLERPGCVGSFLYNVLDRMGFFPVYLSLFDWSNRLLVCSLFQQPINGLKKTRRGEILSSLPCWLALPPPTRDHRMHVARRSCSLYPAALSSSPLCRGGMHKL